MDFFSSCGGPVETGDITHRGRKLCDIAHGPVSPSNTDKQPILSGILS